MLELVVGSIPRGEDYFGREDLIETLWSRLRTDNVLLAAPRRFGKTGAMFRLLDDPREPFRPIYINVQDTTTAAGFMIELLAALLRDRHFSRILREFWTGTKGLGAWLRNLPASIDLGGLKIELREKAEVGENWQAYGEQVMELLARRGPRLLLLIDEFADMANEIEKQDRDQVARFLRWFRSARLAPETQTRFVLGSSVNLLSTLDSMGLVDTVNDLSIVRLKPFNAKTAELYIEQIFESRKIHLEPGIKETILDQLGAPIPYLLAVLLTALFDRQRAAGGDVDASMVRDVFEEDLLTGGTAVTFRHYRSRLDEYYTQLEARAAKAILGTLSRVDRPVDQSTIYQLYLKTVGLTADPQHAEDFLQLMNKLENDFYVVKRDECFTFFSRVLGAWWKTKFGFLGE